MRHIFMPLLLGSILVSSCGTREITGKGNVVTVGRQVADCQKIHVGSSIVANITVQPGAPTSIQLTGYQNLLEHIQVTSTNGELDISTKPAITLDTDKDVVATIVISSLDKLDLSGAANATISSPITIDKFKLDISGAGEAEIAQITAKDVRVDISGAGKAIINGGATDILRYEISGAGSIEAFGLQGQNVHADVSGAGEIELTAINTLRADVSGAGSIRYKGNPPNFKSETSGAGEIESAN